LAGGAGGSGCAADGGSVAAAGEEKRRPARKRRRLKAPEKQPETIVIDGAVPAGPDASVRPVAPEAPEAHAVGDPGSSEAIPSLGQPSSAIAAEDAGEAGANDAPQPEDPQFVLEELFEDEKQLHAAPHEEEFDLELHTGDLEEKEAATSEAEGHAIDFEEDGALMEFEEEHPPAGLAAEEGLVSACPQLFVPQRIEASAFFGDGRFQSVMRHLRDRANEARIASGRLTLPPADDGADPTPVATAVESVALEEWPVAAIDDDDELEGPRTIGFIIIDSNPARTTKSSVIAQNQVLVRPLKVRKIEGDKLVYEHAVGEARLFDLAGAFPLGCLKSMVVWNQHAYVLECQGADQSSRLVATAPQPVFQMEGDPKPTWSVIENMVWLYRNGWEPAPEGKMPVPLQMVDGGFERVCVRRHKSAAYFRVLVKIELSDFLTRAGVIHHNGSTAYYDLLLDDARLARVSLPLPRPGSKTKASTFAKMGHEEQDAVAGVEFEEDGTGRCRGKRRKRVSQMQAALRRRKQLRKGGGQSKKGGGQGKGKRKWKEDSSDDGNGAVEDGDPDDEEWAPLAAAPASALAFPPLSDDEDRKWFRRKWIVRRRRAFWAGKGLGFR